MTNKVELGFFSFTEITDPAEHRAYNEWHLLDHLPEQFPLAGVAFGQRWVSTPACAAARAADGSELAPIHYMTLYLMTHPVRQTLDEFMDLGRRLDGLGRFHAHRRSLLSGPFQRLSSRAAARVLISDEAVPYRPATGVYVVVEEGPAPDAWARSLHTEHEPAMVGVDGVAGVWSFAANRGYGSRWSTGERRITVCWLDGPVLEVAEAMRPVLDRRWADAPVRPELAGPFETIRPWEWDWFDPAAPGNGEGHGPRP